MVYFLLSSVLSLSPSPATCIPNWYISSSLLSFLSFCCFVRLGQQWYTCGKDGGGPADHKCPAHSFHMVPPHNGLMSAKSASNAQNFTQKCCSIFKKSIITEVDPSKSQVVDRRARQRCPLGATVLFALGESVVALPLGTTALAALVIRPQIRSTAAPRMGAAALQHANFGV
ncbi:hypothetical protein TIFTF001_034969 [Ficus carica]|uniref:Uncharacterized protein n=1 Tax=Ficus carica TaxID=3494 RepID=A0AA88E1D8_FICCA|nr:hypothetical protein TIFTF001_034969 [Ficus carica]